MLPAVLSPQHFRDDYISPDSPAGSGSLARGQGSVSLVDTTIQRGQQEAACSSSREAAADSAAAATGASGDLEQLDSASSGTAGGEELSDDIRGYSMADAATPNLAFAVMRTSFDRGSSILHRPQLLQLYQVGRRVSMRPDSHLCPYPLNTQPFYYPPPVMWVHACAEPYHAIDDPLSHPFRHRR